MRILFASNFYPPSASGGYEQLCSEAAGELAGRGHEVAVLTSVVGRGPSATEEGAVQIHRVLRPEVVRGVLDTTVRIWRRKQLERDTLRSVTTVVGGAMPEVALIWGMWNVPRSVPALLECLLPERVAYYLCDYWPSLPSAYQQKFQTPAIRSLTSVPKRLVAAPALAYLSRQPTPRLRLDRPMCVSEAVRQGLIDRGIPVPQARVVHNGIRLEDFPFRVRYWADRPVARLRLLYAGRLTADKGVHTAIKGMALLSSRGVDAVHLDIVGSGDRHYERHIRELVQQHGLQRRVSFRGIVARSAMSRVLAEYDALLFPSEWDEPLPRMPMEAMATGLVVVGTATGGTGELLVDNETGLTFAPGDAHGLATQIEHLLEEPALGARLARAGRQRVGDRFSFNSMMDELESVLQEMVHPW